MIHIIKNYKWVITTLNKNKENIAIKIEGNKVVVEKKTIYLKLVSDPSFPLLFSFKIL